MKEYEKNQIFFISAILSTKSCYIRAIKQGLDKESQIFIWGRKSFPEVEEFAIKNKINITRVEDGFIRSISIGSNFTRPYSLVLDDAGIYFDATRPSRLENILNTYEFNNDILAQAKRLHEKILQSKLSKYNNTSHKSLNLPYDKIKILIPGQVETDASIEYGAKGMTNLELLKKVRRNNPDAYIVYKPHPDVLSKNRKGDITIQEAKVYCDSIISDVSVASILQVVNEVHTMTSLVGFEGLLYGKKVVTYGMPFYAGWGLTKDFRTESRRNRKLTLSQMIAAAYILYPRYISPKTLQYCSPEVLIDELTQEKHRLDKSFFYRMLRTRVSLWRIFTRFLFGAK